MQIEEFLEKEYGYNPTVKNEWKKYINLWESWYKGNETDFHNYIIYNGREEISMKRSTLNMAKKCCEDWADLLFNEKCTITLADKSENDILQSVLDELNFWEFVNKSIERAGALGTGAIILSLDNIINNGIKLNTEKVIPNLSYVDIHGIFPISWNNKKITECAFIDSFVDNGQKYCVMSVHIIGEKGTYIIKNHLFKTDDEGNITEEIENNSILKEFDTLSSTAWFAIISPNSNNNKQKNSPFGLSFFANSIDILESIDMGFDTFINEIELSRKRIFVRDDLIDYDPDGKRHPVFHSTDIAVYTLPNGMDKDDLIQSENSEIRSQALEKYLKNMLSIFSDSVGFETNFYTFDNNTAVKTATEVISNNNKMYRRKRKHEILLESALYDIVSCLCKALTDFAGNKLSSDGLTIKFDDSIIEDTQAISNRALSEYNNGLISAIEYRQKVFGESRLLAEERYQEVLEQDKKYKAQQEDTKEKENTDTEII